MGLQEQEDRRYTRKEPALALTWTCRECGLQSAEGPAGTRQQSCKWVQEWGGRWHSSHEMRVATVGSTGGDEGTICFCKDCGSHSMMRVKGIVTQCCGEGQAAPSAKWRAKRMMEGKHPVNKEWRLGRPMTVDWGHTRKARVHTEEKQGPAGSDEAGEPEKGGLKPSRPQEVGQEEWDDPELAWGIDGDDTLEWGFFGCG